MNWMWSLFIKFYMESITNWYIFCFKNCTDLQKLYIHQADKNGLVSGRVKGQNNFSKLNNFCKQLKEQSGKFIFGNLKYFSHQLCEFLSPSLTFTNHVQWVGVNSLNTNTILSTQSWVFLTKCVNNLLRLQFEEYWALWRFAYFIYEGKYAAGIATADLKGRKPGINTH